MAKKGSAYNNDNIYKRGVIRGALSMDVLSLIISKTIQRIGMSVCLPVFPIVFSIVQDQFPKDKLAVAQGTLASMFAFEGGFRSACWRIHHTIL